jgi:hypothetical protein
MRYSLCELALLWWFDAMSRHDAIGGLDPPLELLIEDRAVLVTAASVVDLDV